MRRLNILIWHVHGAYLYYFSQIPHNIYVASKPDRKGDYIGRWGHIPWPENVIDAPVEDIPSLPLDCVVFQRPNQFLEEQDRILSKAQKRLPKIYIEHDPPTGHPTDTRHFLDDPNVLLVHVTPFNALMWDSGRTPVRVIDHGVVIPEGVRYTGEKEKGIVVFNHLSRRGRLAGADVFETVRKSAPLDLIGMEAEKLGGLGEVIHKDLPAFVSKYRFFFHTTRYTSLGLAVCEAMMAGLPIVSLATTEMASVITNDVNGYMDTRVESLAPVMKELIRYPALAREWGEDARRTALERFNIQRFIMDWDQALAQATGAAVSPAQPAREAEACA